MCALYCEPTFRDFGVHWFGQRGFGGLLEDYSKRTDGKSIWIPQYNLQAYWRRSIPPISVGFVEPLIPARLRNSKFDRLPGSFSHKTPPYLLENRNLLGTKYSEDDKIVEIWTVNERSRRNFVEKFDLKIDEKGEIIGDNWCEDENNKEWIIENDTVLEIRKSKWKEKDSMWIRTTESLKFLQADIQQTIFKSSVKNFSESYSILGEFCVIDYGGMIWLGDLEEVGGKLSRLKIENKEDDGNVFEHVAWCNHPRQIAFSTKYKLNIFDIRTKDDILSLFQTKQFDARKQDEPILIQEKPPDRETVKHIRQLNKSTHNFIVLTNHSLYLLDDRFPMNPVVTINHTFNPHSIIISEKGCKEDEGEISSIFAIDQLIPAIYHCKLYKHKTEVWSDVNGFVKLDQIDSFNSTCRRGKFANKKSIRNEYSRAISLVEGIIDRKQNESCILLRQADDGSIWSQKFVNKTINEKKIMEKEQKSWKRVKSYIEKCDNVEPVYVVDFDKELRCDAKEERIAVSIDGNLEKKIVRKLNTKSNDEMRRVGGLHFESTSSSSRNTPKNLESFNHILSKVVMDAWK